MPVKVPDNLPAKEILTHENIFLMDETRALQQDIRALRIAVLNLMPTKVVTETQILRVLSNSPLQVELTLLHPATHVARNTPADHLAAFYCTFGDVKSRKFDGLIITGAPVEHLEFTEVTYWDELTQIMDWAEHSVTSTLYICWAAQAGLYHRYQIPKHRLASKMFGVYWHRIRKHNTELLRGFDEGFFAPHSRHTTIKREDVERVAELDLLAESDEAGVYIVAAKNGRHIFVTGHSEYDRDTLKSEYERDMARGLQVNVPVNYFPGNDPNQVPVVRWRAHANLLFANWLNYYVYQETPYDLNQVK